MKFATQWHARHTYYVATLPSKVYISKMYDIYKHHTNVQQTSSKSWADIRANIKQTWWNPTPWLKCRPRISRQLITCYIGLPITTCLPALQISMLITIARPCKRGITYHWFAGVSHCREVILELWNSHRRKSRVYNQWQMRIWPLTVWTTKTQPAQQRELADLSILKPSTDSLLSFCHRFIH